MISRYSSLEIEIHDFEKYLIWCGDIVTSAPHCTTLQHAATRGNTLQHRTNGRESSAQREREIRDANEPHYIKMLWSMEPHHTTLQHTATLCSTRPTARQTEERTRTRTHTRTHTSTSVTRTQTQTQMQALAHAQTHTRKRTHTRLRAHAYLVAFIGR